MGSSFFYYLFIYYYCYYFYRVPPITLWGLLPFAVELLPFSLLGSSPSHCASHCLIGLLPPSAWGPFASHSSEGLLPIFPWGSSPCYYGGCLPSWLLDSPPFLAGAPPLSLGLIPISFTQLWGFPTSLWGFHTSLWGSTPFLRGASSRCGALPHLAHSTVGLPHISVGLFPSRSLNSEAYPHLCGALHHLSVGLHLAVGLFPISLTQLWGFSTSLCGSLPLSPWGFLSLRGSSLSRSLNCKLTQLWHSTGSCILLLAPFP